MLKAKLKSDYLDAFKAGDKDKAQALKYLLSQIKYQEIDKKEELDDQEVIKILQKELKKRQEAIKLYQKGDRDDLVKKEQQELKLIEAYLPAQLSQDEVEALVDDVITQGANNLGEVIQQVLKRSQGKTDGSVVAPIAKTKLNQ